MGYRGNALVRKAENSPAQKVLDLMEKQTREDAALPAASPDLLANQRDDVIQIRRTNPQIYDRSRIFKVPTYLVG